MRTIELMGTLKKYPLFTENDVAKMVSKKPRYIRKILYLLRKKGLIYRIERGKYTVHEDPLIFASYILSPSYVSLWSALRYYNLTEQLPKSLFVMVPQSKSPLKFDDAKIEFTKTKYFFGYRKERYQGFDIFMAEPEKAVIDSLLSKKIPLDEISKAIKSQRLNIKKFIIYLFKIKQKVLAKRLGFILEENGYGCSELKKLVDNNYVLLDVMLKKKGKKNKKWRVIDNR